MFDAALLQSSAHSRPYTAAEIALFAGEEGMATGARLAKSLMCVNLEAAHENFKKLAKRARKIGVPAPSFKVVGTHQEWEFRSTGGGDRIYFAWRKSDVEDLGERRTGGVRTVHHVILLGCETVKYAGWSFLAVLDHELGEGNTIIRKSPLAETELPVDWKHKENFCDHCRRKQVRKQTFVIKHEDGRLMQVGSTCAKDFFGHDVAKALGLVELITLVKDFFDAESELYMSGGEPTLFDTVEFLAWAAKAIREGGWVSRAKARESGGVTATADVAATTMAKYRQQCRR